MTGWVKYREGLARDHFRYMSLRDYAVFSAILPLQIRSGPQLGRVGTRKQISEQLGKQATVYKSIDELVRQKYLRLDENGVVWVMNPEGGLSKVRR